MGAPVHSPVSRARTRHAGIPVVLGLFGLSVLGHPVSERAEPLR